MYVCIYLCIYTCTYVSIYLYYIYIERERDKGRELPARREPCYRLAISLCEPWQRLVITFLYSHRMGRGWCHEKGAYLSRYQDFRLLTYGSYQRLSSQARSRLISILVEVSSQRVSGASRIGRTKSNPQGRCTCRFMPYRFLVTPFWALGPKTIKLGIPKQGMIPACRYKHGNKRASR